MKIKKFSLNMRVLISIWIILWCINFLNLQQSFFVIGSFLAILIVIKFNKVSYCIIKQELLIISFSWVYALFVFAKHQKGIGFAVVYAFVPVSAFVCGYYYISKSKDVRDSFIKLLDMMVLAMFVYASLNMINVFRNGWSYNLRGTYDFWTGEHVNATNQGGYLALTALYLPVILFCRKQLERKKKLIYFVEILLSVIYTLLLANRTYFILLLLEGILCYVLYIRTLKNKSSFIFKSIVSFLIISVIAIVLFYIDFLGIQTFWKSTTFYTRMQYMGTRYDVTVKDNDRFPTWLITLKTIPTHLFGGKPDGVTISYAHNMWLDIQWVGGIIPALLMLIITLFFFIYSVKVYKKSQDDTVFRIILISYVFCVLLECAVEPIIEGYYYIFVTFFVMYGAIMGCYSKLKVNR